MQATTINEVITILDKIIKDSKASNNPIGYFAILYREVTRNVKHGIEKNQFEDNQRMEILDVHFANRFFEAYFNQKENIKTTQSWQIAFSSVKENHLVLQYLLQGINAHINLDLGIATVKTIGNNPIQTIENDFNAINNLLAEMVDDVKLKMSAISPMFKILMPLAKKWDEKVVQFSIEAARNGAWEFANQLYSTPSKTEDLIKQRDEKVFLLGKKLVSPSRFLSWILKTILFFESGTVADKMKILEENVKA